MQERIKIFTHISGHGTTLLEPPLEDHINQWLATVNGKITHINQSESERPGGGQHITVCIWYVPEETAPSATS